MTDTEIYKEWQKLCEEHAAAHDAHFNAFEVVSSKFAAIAQGNSQTNPSEEELSEFERTWQAWESIKNRMSEFVKNNV